MAGIFSRGRETVLVWPEVVAVDEWGNRVLRAGDPLIDDPVVVRRCIVQPVTEDADLSQGYRALSMYRVLTRRWPSSAKGIAFWRDQWWEIMENPARRQYTPRTAHDTVFLKARVEERFGEVQGD